MFPNQSKASTTNVPQKDLNSDKDELNPHEKTSEQTNSVVIDSPASKNRKRKYEEKEAAANTEKKRRHVSSPFR